MIKQILIIMMAIMFIASVSALYSGEDMEISSGMTQVTYWSLTGNSSFVNITNTTNSFHIYVAEDANPDSFSLYMEGYKNEEQPVQQGGGGSLAYVLPNGSITYKKPTIINKTVEVNNPILNTESTNDKQTPVIKETPKKGLSIANKVIISLSILLGMGFILYLIFGKKE